MAIYDKTKAPKAQEIIADVLGTNATYIEKHRWKEKEYYRPALFRILDKVYAAPTNNKEPSDIPAKWTALPVSQKFRNRVVFVADADFLDLT